MKVLKGLGEWLLYLDFDGVLHHENVLWHPRHGIYLGAPPEFTLFQHVALLEMVLAPYPEVRIVLSTSWVRVLGFSRTLKRLTPALQSRVIGATYHSRMNEAAFTALPRGIQVLDDVHRRRPAGWIALDDDGAGWPDLFRENLILTDEHNGLSPAAIQHELRRKLIAMCAGAAGADGNP